MGNTLLLKGAIAAVLAMGSIVASASAANVRPEIANSAVDSPVNAANYSWTFTDQNNVVIGSGMLNMYDNIIITAMNGTLNGQKITFYPNKAAAWRTQPNGLNLISNNPVPGETLIQNIPNSGGANVSYDDIYNYANGVTYVGGVAFSTGCNNQTCHTLQVYFLTRDNSSYDINTPTDLFSIDHGNYVQVEGTFAITHN